MHRPSRTIGLAIALLLLALSASAGAAPLPDGRAYELVSPAEKLGTEINANASGEQTGFPTPVVSADGNAVAFTTFDGLPGGTANGFVSTYRAGRGAGGWTTTQLDSPLNPVPNFALSLVVAHDPTLHTFLQAGPVTPKLTPNAAEGTGNFYLHEAGGYRLITVGAPANDEQFIGQIEGHSEDLRHVLFTTSGVLSGTVAPAGVLPVLYDWSAASGEPVPVDVLPGGSFAAEAAELAKPPSTGSDSLHWNQVSSDGSRVFFTIGAGIPAPQLYVRIGGAQTKQVSKSQRSPVDPLGPKKPIFRYASADGSRAFFTSAEKLTNDATTGAADAGQDLYRYDVGTGALTDLAVDASDANGAQVQGVLGGARDGSDLYFVAKGVLATGGVAGALNLYRWVDNGSAKGAVSFIAGGVNAANWEANQPVFANRLPARVTADGSHLLFESTANLTGYSAQGHYEVFLYTAATNKTVCVSCNPASTPASADALAVGTIGDAGSEAHTLSQDGSRVFFTTTEKLLPADTNAVADVYEYNATLGALALISAGTGTFPSLFADATPSGNDADFLTRDRLVGIDRDENFDVYDARVGGGIAAQNPPGPPAECLGDACRGPVPALPSAPSPQSTSPSEGNPAPAPARKKRKRRRHKRKHHHHRKVAHARH